ncbi:MAG: hypothetical protein HOP07_17865 [Bacteriovoracaceae bacterium]|nr:hypothetical protein [Bacteriovoracaceae bacterium]
MGSSLLLEAPRKDPELLSYEKEEELIRELKRKDKALAEFAARVVLLKKSHLFVWSGRGQLVCSDLRAICIELIKEANLNGCRKEIASKDCGLCIKTIERWEKSY